MRTTPKFKHPECNGCRFMGGVSVAGQPRDIWKCGDSWIIRWSDNLADYSSFPKVNALSSLEHLLTVQPREYPSGAIADMSKSDIAAVRIWAAEFILDRLKEGAK